MLKDPFVSPELEDNLEGRPLTGPRGLWAGEGFSRHPDPRPGPLNVHVHPHLEVGIVLAGAAEISYRDYTLLCRPGEIWLCGPWEPHGWRHASPDEIYIELQFRPEFIGEELLGEIPWLTLFAAPPAQRPWVTSARLRQRVLAIGEIIRQEARARPRAWESVIRFELLRLLTELGRAWQGAAPLGDADKVRVSDLARVMPAVNLVHTMPWRRVPNAEAAAACRMGPSAFHSIFRRTFRMSFHEFGLRARLSFAARQLLNTSQTVEALAVESGFVDASHLRRCFRDHYGCTPAQYRRSMGLPPA